MAILTNVIDVPDAQEIAAYSSDAGPLMGTGVTLLTCTYLLRITYLYLHTENPELLNWSDLEHERPEVGAPHLVVIDARVVQDRREAGGVTGQVVDLQNRARLVGRVAGL